MSLPVLKALFAVGLQGIWRAFALLAFAIARCVAVVVIRKKRTKVADAFYQADGAHVFRIKRRVQRPGARRAGQPFGGLAADCLLLREGTAGS